MKKRLVKGFIGIGALAFAFTTASCGLSDIASLIPGESTEEEVESTQDNENYSNGSSQEEEESKIQKLAREKGYECEFHYLGENDSTTVRFGCKGSTYWFENLGEDSGAFAIQVKENKDILYYEKEDGVWKYKLFLENTDVDLSGFNIYQYLLSAPSMDETFKKGASQTIAGRKCDVYSVTANTISTKATVMYYVDQEYGILLKMEATGDSFEGSSLLIAFETTKFVVNPSLPNLPEPADYKNTNPETGSQWDLFKTVGLEGLVPSGYSSISNIMSMETDDDYSYFFSFDGYTKEQYKAKLNELVGTFNTVLKAKGDGGKLYKQSENYKEDLEEISSFVLGGLYDDPDEADACIVVGDKLYWVTLSYNDYLGGGILVQVRIYDIEE